MREDDKVERDPITNIEIKFVDLSQSVKVDLSRQIRCPSQVRETSRV